jgi:Zn finger protein HypA/HybF involved in hydrogenase expression
MLNVNETDTNHVSNKDKENSHHRIYFLICNACFWCASCIDIEKMNTKNSKCPYCDNAKLKLTHVILSSDQKHLLT